MTGTTSARAEILARVRAALDREGLGSERLGSERLPSVDVPREYAAAGSADLAPERVVDLFVRRVEDYGAGVVRVPGAGIADAVASALGPAGRVAVPEGLPGAWLAGVDESRLVRDDALTPAQLDKVPAVVTAATAGIAATGTVVLDHGPGQGRRALSLIPDLHVCVLRQAQVVADVTDAVAQLAQAVARRWPMTWISGPSATSDIELQRVAGVHGPRTLRIILALDQSSR